MSRHMLIPVDFSDASMFAVRVGFWFARVLGMTPVLMHVYPLVWLGDDTAGEYLGENDPMESELADAIAERDMMRAAEHRFRKFRKQLTEKIESGDIADVKYTTLLQQGIPEDEILGYCREQHPGMVLMSTRGISRKEEDLIGSVTAEVLDSCEVPVFTIPDNYPIEDSQPLKRMLLFCTLDQYDVPALEKLMHTFNSPEIDVWLMPVTHRHAATVQQLLNSLFEKLSNAWPNATFHEAPLLDAKIDAQLETFIKNNQIQLIIAPNRRASILTRLFRPSVAHQCLFTIDIPMLALPADK